MMTVPTFINQLLLLLSSGMVLQEALETIAKKYGEEDFKGKNYFTSSVYEIYREAEKNGDNFLKRFCSFSRTCQVKELSERPQGYESSYVRKADMIEREFDDYIESKLEQ